MTSALAIWPPPGGQRENIFFDFHNFSHHPIRSAIPFEFQFKSINSILHEKMARLKSIQMSMDWKDTMKCRISLRTRNINRIYSLTISHSFFRKCKKTDRKKSVSQLIRNQRFIEYRIIDLAPPADQNMKILHILESITSIRNRPDISAETKYFSTKNELAAVKLFSRLTFYAEKILKCVKHVNSECEGVFVNIEGRSMHQSSFAQ